MTRLLLVLLLALSVPVGAWGATTYYVRPADDGNGTTFTYGASDGSNAANAFEGFADIAGLSAGDTVCLPGSDEPFFERLDTGTVGTIAAPVTYVGCGSTPALIWYAQGLSGNRSFDSSRVLINTAPYAWATAGTDIYKKRIDVRPRMLWEGSTWLTPIDCDAASEATILATLAAGGWCVKDNTGTYLIYYHSTTSAISPSNTVIYSEYVPYSDGSTTAIINVDVAWNVFRNITVRGVSASSSSRSLYITASNTLLDTMTFERNKEGPSIIPGAGGVSGTRWLNIDVFDSCENGTFISPVSGGVQGLYVYNSEFSRSAGSCYNGTNFTAGDGDGFAIGQGGGTATDVTLERIRTDDNANAGIFVGTSNAMTVTNFDVFSWVADGNGQNCYGEDATNKQIVGRMTISGFICQNTTSSTSHLTTAFILGDTPGTATAITIANGVFSNNNSAYRILFRPDANNNYVFANLVFVNSGIAGDTRDISSSDQALIGDEVFKNIYFYTTPNLPSRFAKLGSTSYYYSVAGDPAAFVTATGGTGINVNVDPLLISTTDLRTQSTSPLRRTGTSSVVCRDVRGRACYPDSPDIGAYQATSGDPSTTRSAASARTAAGARSPVP